jgi:signal transduction histidine kinase
MRRSLNALITWSTAAVATVGLVTLVALIAITSVLHLVARDLSMEIESMRVADAIERQLLLYHRSRDPLIMGTTRAALLEAVDEAGRFIESAEEQRQVDELRGAIEAYFRTDAGDAEIAAALSAAHKLSTLNVEEARRAQERANRLDRLATVGGPGAAIALVVGVAGFLIWLRRGPFRQISELSRAMEGFSAGDLDSRASEDGPRELAVMARTFNGSADALVRTRQRQTEYVATAIHDLRTPLTAIQLAVGYIAPGRPLPPEPRLRQLVELIGRQLTRINGLIGDILNATRIEAGDLSLLRTPLDLRAIALKAVRLFRSLAPEHVIDLTMPPQPLMLHGDRARLEQVLNNLLSNAVKYSPFGSRVRVELARTGTELILEVSDEGPGIPPEDRPQIFEAFARHSATHEEAPGTSLGLWVSRRVVEAHGGRIELESRVGHGSTFRVILPAVPPPPEPAAAEVVALPGGS